MKKIFTIVSAAFLTANTYSQSCENLIYFRTNTEFSYVTKFKKFKGEVKGTYKSSSVGQSANWKVSQVNVIFNESGSFSSAVSGKVMCDGSMLRIDAILFLGTGNKDPDYKNSYVEYPVKMSVGQALKDGKLLMEFKGTGTATARTMVADITDRKVTGKQTITTPAGTFNCLVISSMVDSGFMDDDGTKKDSVKRSQTEWFDPAYGIIQIDSDLSTTQLVSIGKK